ncbi:MAG: adenylyltransferase/cytidyltransferase family protein [Thermoplasmata archaeon]|nr:adenylyltransferase/cytidyltransferase family protein [Thermoplasmata archaeon]
MVRVMASGVFDLIHLGHVHYLEEAKKLGDELVVVVARDSTVRKEKHEPITPEEFRRDLVESLKPVDRAVLGGEGDMFKVVEELRPDIIALGYDQYHDAERIEAELKERGLDIEVVRLDELNGDLDGTRKIIKKVVDWFSASEKLRKAEEGDE